MLMWLWRRLIRGCDHKWTIYKEGRITFAGAPCGEWYDLQCQHCGTIKRKNCNV